MAIEFRCGQCGKLLRTPEGTSGQQAKCPACGGMVVVPEPAPVSAPVGESPFVAPGPAAAYEAPAAAQGVRPTKIDFVDVIGQTWDIFKRAWGMSLVVLLLAVFIAFCVLGAVGLPVLILALVTQTVEVFVPAAVLAGFVALVLVTWINVGVILFFIKTARGLQAGIGDLFAGGPYVWRVIGATILYQLGLVGIVAVCALPCALVGMAFGQVAAMAGLIVGAAISIVPVVIYALTFYQYPFLIVDQNLGIMESFAVSREVTLGNRLMMLAIILVVALVGGVISQVTCGLGTLVVAPFQMLSYAVMYLIMIGHLTAGRRPSPPPGA